MKSIISEQHTKQKLTGLVYCKCRDISLPAHCQGERVEGYVHVYVRVVSSHLHRGPLTKFHFGLLFLTVVHLLALSLTCPLKKQNNPMTTAEEVIRDSCIHGNDDRKEMTAIWIVSEFDCILLL